MDINFTGDLQRIQPQPGDVFVLTTEQSLSCEVAEQLKAHLEHVLPGHTVLVLSDGLKLGFMQPPPAVPANYG